VLFSIEEYVDERISHFPRRPQGTSVIAVGKDAAPRRKECVQAPRNPDAESLHAAREAQSVVRLDQHMDVIGLHTKVNNPKKASLRGKKLLPNAEKQ
jgi:hypothetical protein